MLGWGYPNFVLRIDILQLRRESIRLGEPVLFRSSVPKDQRHRDSDNLHANPSTIPKRFRACRITPRRLVFFDQRDGLCFCSVSISPRTSQGRLRTP